eukprot:CAMPEP_0114495214 /NCGR_PEP_ID=MMETSP0109-20121206/5083_1 /TAXON_ID=29199 /ORGANISM="Chlorarachnion reptans, Strain CCCM449" /LENGTH=62 /DNA_ID=CAMNT_0001672337 /DNA_START=1112 /DNA_END=1300 /DNA_ORIENTATION=+
MLSVQNSQRTPASFHCVFEFDVFLGRPDDEEAGISTGRNGKGAVDCGRKDDEEEDEAAAAGR